MVSLYILEVEEYSQRNQQRGQRQAMSDERQVEQIHCSLEDSVVHSALVSVKHENMLNIE